MSGDPIAIADIEALQSGIYPGLLSDQTPLWLSASDVYFLGTGVRPSAGFTNLTLQDGTFDQTAGLFDAKAGTFDATVTTKTFDYDLSGKAIKGVHQQRQSSGMVLVAFGTDTHLGMFDGTAGVVVTYTNLNGVDTANEITDATLWSFEQWGDWIIASNGVDKPKVLKRNSTTNFVDLANYPANWAKIVRRLGPKILAFNTNTGPNQILACKDDDVEQWDPLTNPTALELTVRDFVGEFVAVEPLGEMLAAYGPVGMHLISYGGPFLVTAKKAIEGVKAVSKNSIAVVGNVHYGVMEAGLFATDGTSMQMVAAKQIGDWLAKNVDWSQKSRITSFVDRHRGYIKWRLPMLTGFTRVLMYNYNSDTVSEESTGFYTASRTVDGIGVPLFGTSNGGMFMLIDNPTGRLPSLISRPMPLNSRFKRMFVEGLMFRMSGTGLTVNVRFGDSLADFTPNLAWTPIGTASALESVLWYMREAVYAQVQIVGVQSQMWQLTGIDVIGSTPNAKRF